MPWLNIELWQSTSKSEGGEVPSVVEDIIKDQDVTFGPGKENVMFQQQLEAMRQGRFLDEADLPFIPEDGE